MREICMSGSMRGCRRRAFAWRACVPLYRAPTLDNPTRSHRISSTCTRFELSWRHVAECGVKAALIIDALEKFADA